MFDAYSSIDSAEVYIALQMLLVLSAAVLEGRVGAARDVGVRLRCAHVLANDDLYARHVVEVVAAMLSARRGEHQFAPRQLLVGVFLDDFVLVELNIA